MSWQNISGAMWLRDYLPRDVPTAQVFTYGYPSTLRKSGAHALLLDYTTAFLQELRRLSSLRNSLAVSDFRKQSGVCMDTETNDDTLASTAHTHGSQFWWFDYQAGILNL